MSSRLKRVRSWEETRKNVAKAREFTEKYGVGEAHPDDYMLPSAEQAEWDDLLKQMK